MHDAARMRSEEEPNLAEDIPDLVSSAGETSDDSTDSAIDVIVTDSAIDVIEPPLRQSGYTFAEIHAPEMSVTLTDEEENPHYSGYTLMGGVNMFTVLKHIWQPYHVTDVILLPEGRRINIMIGQISLACFCRRPD